MCGIAVIISGVRVDSSYKLVDLTPATSPKSESVNFSIDDLEVALRRRGPDSLGSKKLLICSNTSTSSEEDEVLSFIEVGENSVLEKPNLRHAGKKCDDVFSANEGSHDQDCSCSVQKCPGQLHFIGATLQLRGMDQITQPFVDSSGNILVYNGVRVLFCKAITVEDA